MGRHAIIETEAVHELCAVAPDDEVGAILEALVREIDVRHFYWPRQRPIAVVAFGEHRYGTGSQGCS
jgi:hypothetical protein